MKDKPSSREVGKLSEIRNIVAHCRFGISYRTAPVVFFVLSLVPSGNLGWNAIQAMIIAQFLLFPSSSVYNDYWDKDTGPIGCLEHPPPVTDSLYWTSLAMDVTAAIWGGYSFGGFFFLYVLIFGSVHRAYSHPSIRLKASPIKGALLTTNFTQGYITVFGLYYAASGQTAFETLSNPQVHFGGVLMTLVLIGIAPVFQIYQHNQDRKAGETSVSMLMGVGGTMWYTFCVMSLSGLAHLLYFHIFLPHPLHLSGVFLVFMSPVLVHFLGWWGEVRKDERNADFRRTMRFTLISSTMGSLFYAWLTIWGR